MVQLQDEPTPKYNSSHKCRQQKASSGNASCETNASMTHNMENPKLNILIARIKYKNNRKDIVNIRSI